MVLIELHRAVPTESHICVCLVNEGEFGVLMWDVIAWLGFEVQVITT